MSDGIRVGVNRYGWPTGAELRQLAQLGAEDLLLTRWQHDGIDSAMPVSEVWTERRLREIQAHVRSAGLRLYAVQTLPVALYDLLLGWPDVEAELQVVTETIRNLGAVGVDVLGYSGHPPDGFGRTGTVSVRGGATAARFDADAVAATETVADPPTEAALWEAYEGFLDRVLPVAEDAGVTLALHPSDPPVAEMGGVPLLFRDPESFERAMALGPSDNHGLKFCIGSFSQMGVDVPAAIRSVGDDVVYVHFRDVVGSVPDFHETFLDDPASNFDEFDLLDALRDVGFEGVVMPDHVPALDGEPEWEYGGLGGYAYSVGYLRAMVRAAERYD
ncbi:MAG: mannonate dehydratase [Halobacteriaceae archaeon]